MKAVTKKDALNGKPYAGNPHIRFDEDEVVLVTPRRGSLLYSRKMIKAASAVLLMAAAFVLPVGADQSKMLLVLQCGSDWCVSGEDVRRVFEGAEFRRLLGGRYEFAVYDNMDFPTPEVKAANKKLDALIVPTRRFPAITCLTGEPRRFFGQMENIPFSVSAKDLAERIAAFAKMKDAALECFARAKESTEDGAKVSLYGKAFELLSAQVGDLNGKSLREGKLAWKEEWKALAELDKDDRFGWKFRFEKGIGVDLVEKATSFRTANDFEGGRKFIESLRRIPSEHFPVDLKQVVDIAEYALYRKDATRIESNKALLRRVMALGGDTVWGMCAHGYLMLSGEKLEPRVSYRAPVRPRPEKKAVDFAARPFPDSESIVAGIVPGGNLSDKQKLEIARYAVLRRIGKDGWEKLNARPGAEGFVNAFFFDRKWMEDFVWSGKCANWTNAIFALESVVYQDNGRWVKLEDSTSRRFATAVALAHPEKDEAWLADVVDAYRSTALSKRLHRLALDQEVWKWRIALSHTMPCSTPHGSGRCCKEYLRSLPQQQRFLDHYVNLPLAQYANTCWIVPYRSFNCFGENVQGKFYYESWFAANVDTIRRITPHIGGVCGELSKFGSGCGNAHGLPSAPVGQPRHCALTRRLPGGTWEINYSVNRGTGFFSILPFRGTDSYTYCQAHEGTFDGPREVRLNADRCLELAAFAESKKLPPEEIARRYAAACSAWPHHYIAWRLRGDWIAGAGRSLEEHRLFANECVNVLKGWRQPLWDILTPYFERVNKERGAAAFADELVRMMPALRQGEDKMQEEGFFDRALSRWTKPIGKDAALTERVAVAALEAQAGTKDYFAQTLSWCADFIIADAGRFGRFAELLGRLSGGNGQNIDFGRIILAASKAGNFAAFRQMAELQAKVSPLKRQGKGYPEKDFGGVLVSADAMLRTSSTSCWERPASYPLGLDALPLSGNAFHTDKEKEPWAMVVLAGECRVRGVLVANPGGYRGRQPPIEVQLSGDGKEWRTVFSDDAVRTEYRVDLGDKSVVAKFVRVRRVPGAREDFFHLNKILVYGDRMY